MSRIHQTCAKVGIDSTQFALQRENLDEDCITELAVHYGLTKDEMKAKVSKVRRNHPVLMCTCVGTLQRAHTQTRARSNGR